MLFSSTIVTYGSATGVVVFTGMKTAVGRVQKQVSEAAGEEGDTPLKQKLDDFGEKLSYLIGAVCLLVWIMNFNNFFDDAHGSAVKGCIYYFKIAIALAVAAIPEGLPAVITTCLALGTRKMAVNNAIVRRLPSVETLGCTTVICSDKTGTLTRNEMAAVVFGVWTTKTRSGTRGDLSVWPIAEGKETYNPARGAGNSWGDIDSAAATYKAQFEALAVGCSFNNNAGIEQRDGAWTRVGEPTEAAMKVLAEKLQNAKNLSYSKSLQSKLTKVAQLDFTSKRKAMSVVVSGYKSERDMLLKGAPDRILAKCTKLMTPDGAKLMEQADRETLERQIDDLSHRGLRVLAVAEIPGAGRLASLNDSNKAQLLGDFNRFDDFEQDAVFVGVVGIRDPPRPDVAQAIADCHTAGIRVIMITGDAVMTAVSIAKELGIVPAKSDAKAAAVSGAVFQNMSHEERLAAVAKTNIFARVEPAHKRDLVKCLIEQDQIVAMTGDGVNDAPALKQAHIGVAMGIAGTEVAKMSSDMVLADDNFATIVKAVEEGRSIYSNMKAFIRYLISSNIGEVLSIFFTAALGIPEGFSSVQLLWVNLVTDGPPATALGFNPPDVDIMKKPPRKKDDDLLSNWVLVRYCVIGFYVGLATVGIFIYWYLFAETGDGHTLVTWYQLTHWAQCPSWSKAEFSPANFIEGIDLQANPCAYFTAGKVKASTLSLSVLVVIEMLNALNAISEDNSLLTMSPFVNPYLLLAIAASIGLHVLIVYEPFCAQIFGIAAMNLHEWGLVFGFSAPVIVVDEVLKVVGRARNEAELKERMAKKKRD
jgi:Ca2+-transporting ATPase